MQKNLKSIRDLVGNTPLISLTSFSLPGIHLLAKLEMYNPTGSTKDRIVWHMIEQAERVGKLKPGATLVEATSGNTGASLAVVGAHKNYSVILTTPTKTSPEKIAAMRMYGADVRICSEDYMALARMICANTKNGFMLDQYNNRMNVEAHYLTTGPEIWRQTDGKIDYLVACASSGGTISGVGRFLKEQNPLVKIIMADPVGSGFFSYFNTGKIDAQQIQPYRIEGAGKNCLCDCMDFSVIDEVIQVSDANAFAMVKELVSQEGILAGGSSGAALYVAIVLQQQLSSDANIVVIFPDSGLKYLSKMETVW